MAELVAVPWCCTFLCPQWTFPDFTKSWASLMFSHDDSGLSAVVYCFFSLVWWDFVFRFVIFHLHRKDLFNVNASCNLIPSKCQWSNMSSANFNSWKGISFLDDCCLSPFRTLVWVFPVLPAVIWSVTCWQRAVQLWSLQLANCRWWKTGPSATKQPWQHKISLRSSHKDCTSTSGQVGLPICGWGFGHNVDAGWCWACYLLMM